LTLSRSIYANASAWMPVSKAEVQAGLPSCLESKFTAPSLTVLGNRWWLTGYRHSSEERFKQSEQLAVHEWGVDHWWGFHRICRSELGNCESSEGHMFLRS
jgi:hypothetical protein